MRPLDDREWLEQIRVDMLGRSLADYDHATSLLDTLDQCEPWLNGEAIAAAQVLADVDTCTKSADIPGDDPAERVEWCVGELEEMRDLLDCQSVAGVQPAVTSLADLRADLLVLLVDAGIAEPNVMPDDPISILRMFLPVD